ncbi:MAG: hypothetical protein ABIZ95_14450, partial [Pyrinomonadaceae bacterium]
MRKIILTLGCLALLGGAACTPNQQSGNVNPTNSGNTNAGGPMEPGAKSPPADVVSVKIDAVQVKPGGSAEAKLNLGIVSPYHIHANPASLKNLIATTLTIESPPDLTFEAPIYPAPVMKTFSFDKTPLAVWETSAIVSVKLKAGAKSATGSRVIP